MPAPKLTPDRLLAAARALNRLPLDSAAAREVMAILLEAATPDRHDTSRLPGEHGENVRQTERFAGDHTKRVLRRAAEALRQISDEEWQELVDEAEQGDAERTERTD